MWHGGNLARAPKTINTELEQRSPAENWRCSPVLHSHSGSCELFGVVRQPDCEPRLNAGTAPSPQKMITISVAVNTRLVEQLSHNCCIVFDSIRAASGPSCAASEKRYLPVNGGIGRFARVVYYPMVKVDWI